MLRLMCVTAHPDDEAADFGGSLLLYQARGVETFVVCLTPGQAGSHRAGARTDHELASLRKKEFEAACAILKVSRCVVLEYPDGKLHRQDLYRVVCDVTALVREFRPHVMLAMGPEGSVTGHTDHSMASVYATLAFEWAGRSNRYPDQLSDGTTPHRVQKLYYSTADVPLSDREPITLPPATATIQIGGYLETKIAAFKAHLSQQPLWPVFEQNVRRRGPVEKFHLLASVKPGDVAFEDDLFAEVTE
jgi:LmbE family N-acetylglucosaminyl deacetylase